jgi:hypothetical protein
MLSSAASSSSCRGSCHSRPGTFLAAATSGSLDAVSG